MSREITTKCSRDIARAETHIHGGEDPKKTPGQGEEQEKGKDLLLLLPAHVVGPCCFIPGETGNDNKGTKGIAEPQPEEDVSDAVKGKQGKGATKNN